MKNVLITGISGYIGMKITRMLKKSDAVSKIVGIDIQPPENAPGNLYFVRQDIRAPLLDLVKTHRIDTVIHAAYVLPPMHDNTLMEDINVNGTLNVLDACAKGGVSHLLYTSSTTAYGFYPDNPVPLTEDSPLRGNDDFTYAKNKKEIEALIDDFRIRHPGIVITVLRPCVVIGPGIDNPISRYLRKKVVILPRKTAPFQFVHEDDLAEVIQKCLEEKIDGIYNVAGKGTITFPEMVKMLGNLPVYLPEWLLYPANSLFWRMRAGFLTEFPSAGLALLRFPWIATSRKLVEKTGYEFQYDSRSAFENFAENVKRKKRRSDL